MGQRVTIRLKAKDDKSITAVNKMLKKAGIKNSFTTEQENIDWVNDINTNPDSPQKHLKPITLEEIKKVLSIWCEVGALSLDVAFSRTSQEEAKKYAEFILKNKDSIEGIQGGKDLVQRYDLTREEQDCIFMLTTKDPELKKLPKEEQTRHDLQGGLFLCKSFSPSPFWVIFGKVERPTFLKDRIYEDDLMNNIYRDKKGYAYLMIPLLPLNNKQVEFVSEVYDSAAEIGLRENFNFIVPLVYGLDLTNYAAVVDDYRNTYTVEELKDRFYKVMEATQDIYPYNGPNGFVWRDNKNQFSPCGTNSPTVQLQARCSLMTCLVRALPAEIAAETMSTLTGCKYLAFEFK
jgi:hypothetical protein